MAPFPDPLTTLQDHAAFVRAVARRLVADPSDVDDLVQETWLRALANGRAPRSARAWLAKVVRSVWTDRHRAERARRRREQQIADERARTRTAEPTGDDAFGFASLTRALEALPTDYRRVLQLRYHADLSPTAIAAELGVPLPTVKARLARALQMLRNDLDGRHGDGQWRALLIPLLPLPPSTAGTGSAAAVTGVLVNKLLVALVALVALAVLLPHLLEPPATPAVAPNPNTPAGAVVQVGDEASRAAATTGADGVDAAQPQEREAAVAPTANPAPDALVRGRILYQSTGQGVPFLPVFLRAGQRSVELRTDREGAFATADAWPANVEIAVLGAPVPNGPMPRSEHTVAGPDGTTTTTATPSTGIPLLGVSSVLMTNDPERPPAPSAGKAPPMPAFQPLATAAVHDGDAFRLLVELGPTYLLRVAPHERQHGLRLRAFLRDDDDALATRIQRADHTLAALEASPEPSLLWCRVPKPPAHYGDRCRLVVVAEGGFWRAEIADVGTQGVVGPLDVTLQEQGHVRGTVRDAFGVPLAKAHVVVTIGDGARALRFATNTDAQGEYTLTGVQPGAGHAQVAGEAFEPNATAVQVVAGAVATCDLVVRARAKGGSIAGTITTTSGNAFPMVSVHLTSRQDGSIWRTANIDWQEVDGRHQATFAFADVPLIECEVQLNPFAPCRLQARRQTLTPPQEHVHFRIDDVVQERSLSIDVRQRDGTPCPSWTLRLVGDDGWQIDVRAKDAKSPVRIPQLPGTWRLLGPTVRGHTGRLEAIPGDQLVIQAEPGWSMQLIAMDIANYFPVRGAPVFADGQQVGVLDGEGELMLDLPAAPRTLTVDPTHWRLYRDAARRSDVDENGVLQVEGSDTHLGVYLQRVP